MQLEFDIQHPDIPGLSITLVGDTQPTEQDIDQAFAKTARAQVDAFKANGVPKGQEKDFEAWHALDTLNTKKAVDAFKANGVTPEQQDEWIALRTRDLENRNLGARLSDKAAATKEGIKGLASSAIQGVKDLDASAQNAVTNLLRPDIAGAQDMSPEEAAAYKEKYQAQLQQEMKDGIQRIKLAEAEKATNRTPEQQALIRDAMAAQQPGIDATIKAAGPSTIGGRINEASEAAANVPAAFVQGAAVRTGQLLANAVANTGMEFLSPEAQAIAEYEQIRVNQNVDKQSKAIADAIGSEKVANALEMAGGVVAPIPGAGMAAGLAGKATGKAAELTGKALSAAASPAQRAIGGTIELMAATEKNIITPILDGWANLRTGGKILTLGTPYLVKPIEALNKAGLVGATKVAEALGPEFKAALTSARPNSIPEELLAYGPGNVSPFSSGSELLGKTVTSAARDKVVYSALDAAGNIGKFLRTKGASAGLKGEGTPLQILSDTSAYRLEAAKTALSAAQKSGDGIAIRAANQGVTRAAAAKSLADLIQKTNITGVIPKEALKVFAAAGVGSTIGAAAQAQMNNGQDNLAEGATLGGAFGAGMASKNLFTSLVDNPILANKLFNQGKGMSDADFTNSFRAAAEDAVTAQQVTDKAVDNVVLAIKRRTGNEVPSNATRSDAIPTSGRQIDDGVLPETPTTPEAPTAPIEPATPAAAKPNPTMADLVAMLKEPIAPAKDPLQALTEARDAARAANAPTPIKLPVRNKLQTILDSKKTPGPTLEDDLAAAQPTPTQTAQAAVEAANGTPKNPQTAIEIKPKGPDTPPEPPAGDIPPDVGPGKGPKPKAPKPDAGPTASTPSTPIEKVQTKARGKAFKLKYSEGGDIIDYIKDNGGVNGPGRIRKLKQGNTRLRQDGKPMGGEDDGFAETFNQSGLRLLRNASSKQTVDRYIKEFADNGLFKGIETPEDFYAAVRKAYAERGKAEGVTKTLKAEADFQAAALEGTKRSNRLPADKPIPNAAEKLNPGDEFKIKKEPFTVDERLEDGTLLVKDGPKYGTQEIPPGAPLYPDKGSLKQNQNPRTDTPIQNGVEAEAARLTRIQRLLRRRREAEAAARLKAENEAAANNPPVEDEYPF